MPARMQVALLRVLEEREVLPLGGTKPQRADVRVVCATNKDLAEEVRSGRFREDLLHRLDVVRIKLPPLRERGRDLPLLAHHLLRRAGAHLELGPDAMDVLAAHDWPGNVRELDNVLRASALLCDSHHLDAAIVEHVIASRRLPRIVQRAPAKSLRPRASRMMTTMGDDWWSAPRLAEQLGVSTRTVNRELAQLVDSGHIEALGHARARRYRREGCRDTS